MRIPVTTDLRRHLVENHNMDANLCNEDVQTFAVQLVEQGSLDVKNIKTLTIGKEPDNPTRLASKNLTAEKAFGGNSKSENHSGANAMSDVTVKKASLQYKSVRSLGKHRTTGEPVRDESGKEVELASQADYAKAGAFLKHVASKQIGSRIHLSDHEKELMAECFEDKWCGMFEGHHHDSIDGLKVKALLSDATSGGLEVNPIWFDDLIVTYPLLHSELLPLITLLDAPRGGRVENAAIGNPTVTWGTSEGTSVPLFDTASLVSAIDTTIYPVMAAVEVGRDLLADSPVNVGQIVAENIRQRMLAELDRVIAVGSGTGEPEGIFTASGVSAINAAGGSAAAPEVDDAEAMIFGLGKQYRTPGMNCGFLSNDTTYSRFRGISVSDTDVRRVFGMTHNDYSILGHGFKIQNSIGNAKAAFGAFKCYRLYRRKGQEVRWTEDASLARANTMLLTVRGRYGGGLTDSSAFTKIVDLQA